MIKQFTGWLLFTLIKLVLITAGRIVGALLWLAGVRNGRGI